MRLEKFKCKDMGLNGFTRLCVDRIWTQHNEIVRADPSIKIKLHRIIMKGKESPDPAVHSWPHTTIIPQQKINTNWHFQGFLAHPLHETHQTLLSTHSIFFLLKICHSAQHMQLATQWLIIGVSGAVSYQPYFEEVVIPVTPSHYLPLQNKYSLGLLFD